MKSYKQKLLYKKILKSMKTKLETLLEEEKSTYSQVLYLIPNTWWHQFYKVNELKQNKEQLIFPPLQFGLYVDSFLLDFQDNIVAQLEHKKNNLQLHKVVICPQIKKQYEWKFISPQLWKKIAMKCQIKFGVFTAYTEKQINQIMQQNDIQIQIIFCSRSKNQAFVGFLPEKLNAVEMIRKIGFYLGFIEMDNSRITFPDKNSDVSYSYSQLQHLPLNQSQDTLFLVSNLQCYQEKDQKKTNFSFGRDELGNSNEAVAGDMAIIGLQSFQQIGNEGTISTGAQETPSFIGSEQQHRGEFRVRQLFRQKKPQQIKQLKIKAKNIINSTLIGILEQPENIMQHSLENIVQELIEHIHQHKKKIVHKQKQLFHQ